MVLCEKLRLERCFFLLVAEKHRAFVIGGVELYVRISWHVFRRVFLFVG